MSNIANITFGVEIETIVPAGTVRIGAYHVGTPVVSCSGFPQAIPAPTFMRQKWKAEDDGSIVITKPGFRRCEFVSPILFGEEGIKHLIEFVEWLRNVVGAKVNSSCGLHIHLGSTGAAGGEEITAYMDRLARLVSFNTKALYAQTGSVLRERGNYCRPLGSTARKAISEAKRKKEAATLGGAGRYQILNLTNLRRGTVEFRCFAGTLNTNKVLLHLFSVMALALVARKTSTPATWDNRPLTGVRALTNLLKVRPVTKIVGSPIFTERFPAMLSKGLEMATKYDLGQAARDLAALTVNGNR